MLFAFLWQSPSDSSGWEYLLEYSSTRYSNINLKSNSVLEQNGMFGRNLPRIFHGIFFICESRRVVLSSPHAPECSFYFATRLLQHERRAWDHAREPIADGTHVLGTRRPRRTRPLPFRIIPLRVSSCSAVVLLSMKRTEPNTLQVALTIIMIVPYGELLMHRAFVIFSPLLEIMQKLYR